jgi:hypothetical protein
MGGGGGLYLAGRHFFYGEGLLLPGQAAQRAPQKTAGPVLAGSAAGGGPTHPQLVQPPAQRPNRRRYPPPSDSKPVPRLRQHGGQPAGRGTASAQLNPSRSTRNPSCLTDSTQLAGLLNQPGCSDQCFASRGGKPWRRRATPSQLGLEKGRWGDSDSNHAGRTHATPAPALRRTRAVPGRSANNANLGVGLSCVPQPVSPSEAVCCLGRRWRLPPLPPGVSRSPLASEFPPPGAPGMSMSVAPRVAPSVGVGGIITAMALKFKIKCRLYTIDRYLSVQAKNKSSPFMIHDPWTSSGVWCALLSFVGLVY